MATIYLTGALSDYDDPFEWMDELQASQFADDNEFVNPYMLNDLEFGDDEVYRNPQKVVEPAVSCVRDEADALLLRWEDDVFLPGSTIEAWEAHENGVPVVIWYEGYRDDLQVWLNYVKSFRTEDRETAVRVALSKAGDDSAIGS